MPCGVLDIANYIAAQQYHSKTYRLHCDGSARNCLFHRAFQAAPLNDSTGVDERMQSNAYASARSPTNTTLALADWRLSKLHPGTRDGPRQAAGFVAMVGICIRRPACVAYVLRVTPHLCAVPRAACRGDPQGAPASGRRTAAGATIWSPRRSCRPRRAGCSPFR
jgi:hypothetical protein